jgi:predicted amidophosphoribosyltransferase
MSPNDRHNNPSGQDEAFVPLQQRQRYQDFVRECQACQQEIEPDWQACAHCGTRLSTECPGCGNPLPPAGAQLCPSCGLPLPQQAGS